MGSAPRETAGKRRERRAYEPPRIQRIGLKGLSSDPLDSGMPLLADESSNVNPATLFPPPTPH